MKRVFSYLTVGEGKYTLEKWLDTKGGRTASDLLFDEYGYYIEMSDGDSSIYLAYVPKEYQKAPVDNLG